MLNTLLMSLKIDQTYSLNAFIYNLRKLPVFKDLVTEDIYKSKRLKQIIRIIVNIYALLKTVLFHFIYFLAIYFLAYLINKNALSKTFVHIYFLFTIIGFFINNKLLNTSSKKYFSIIIFQMNAKKFLQSYLVSNLFKYLALNILSFFIFNYYLNLSLNTIIILILLPFFMRIIGEALNIIFYKKYSYIWLNNYFLYFTVLISILLLSLLPIKNIFVNDILLFITLLLSIILSPIFIIYLCNVQDYKLIYKKLNTKNMVMSKDTSLAYSRQQMVEVKNKDINISNKKLKNKKCYDLFNTIFFERHKEILLRSAKKYSLVLGIIYVILIILSFNNGTAVKTISSFFFKNLGCFILIMYLINRGAIVTQAMFFNCDHAMLRYNFYREPKVLLNLFKKRLTTLIKVNLLPVFVIILGNSILIFLTIGNNILMYLLIALYIIALSIFFSVHYLVMYYLLQPYNSEMQMKRPSYSLISIITYIVCFYATGISLSYLKISVLGIIFTVIYSVIALYLVNKYSCRTFKIN